MGTHERRTFSAEFKKKAVEMILNGGKRVQEVSRDLDISGTLLSKWKTDYEKLQEESFPGKGHQISQEEELHRLKKELARVKEERDILKKAVGFFSRDA
jgi:transposase